MRFIFGIVAVLMLNSCGSIYQSEPVPFGTDVNALKKSPCACLEVEIVRELPEFLFENPEV